MEIEKKWLVFEKKPDAFKKIKKNARKIKIVQYYISFDPEVRVRKTKEDGKVKYFKTVKIETNTTFNLFVREEIETEISKKTFKKLKEKALAKIEKTRYVTKTNEEYDFFPSGMVLMEKEFQDEEVSKNYLLPKEELFSYVPVNLSNAQIAEKLS